MPSSNQATKRSPGVCSARIMPSTQSSNHAVKQSSNQAITRLLFGAHHADVEVDHVVQLDALEAS
eukprot:7015944-Prymnesium_polylepis.1